VQIGDSGASLQIPTIVASLKIGKRLEVLRALCQLGVDVGQSVSPTFADRIQQPRDRAWPAPEGRSSLFTPKAFEKDWHRPCRDHLRAAAFPSLICALWGGRFLRERSRVVQWFTTFDFAL